MKKISFEKWNKIVYNQTKESFSTLQLTEYKACTYISSRFTMST